MVVVVNAVKKEAADECTEDSSKASSIFIGTPPHPSSSCCFIFVACLVRCRCRKLKMCKIREKNLKP